jgi:hypothetical protein
VLAVLEVAMFAVATLVAIEALSDIGMEILRREAACRLIRCLLTSKFNASHGTSDSVRLKWLCE